MAEGYWDDRGLRDGIENAASLCADAVAVTDNRRTLTWGELSRRVSAGVATLRHHGISPGDPVLLIAGNSAEGLIAYHSLLRAGAMTVVMDRRCGSADLRAAMRASAAGTVIAPAGERKRMEEVLASASVMGLEHFVNANVPALRLEEWLEPDRNEVAIVLFTSGTTSGPKGVTHSINTLTSGARNMALITETDSDTVIFMVSPLTSITGIMQMHLAADQCAALVLEDAFEPDGSLDRLNRSGATFLGGAPVIVERLVKAAEARRGWSLSLRTLGLGGAMLPRPLLERVTEEYGIKVARVYGSSEAPNATGSLPEDATQLRLADDGALMPGTEIRVGSAAHAQEGLIRGPGVFLGYLDDANNEEAFEHDWYRTGDLVELHGNRLTVVGRLKEVVNRNGFKISLAEIDAALLDEADAEECASFSLPDPTTGERLAVAVLPKPGRAVSFESVVGRLGSAGVATRKLPEQVVIWDEPLPRTASGKIIRSRLVMDTPAKRSLLAPRLLDPAGE